MTKTITISNKKNMVNNKPEVKMFKNTTYIVYQEGDDIILSKFEDGKVTELKNVSDVTNGYTSYEPEMYIQDNGVIHIAWVDTVASTHEVKYRNYNIITGSWSDIIHLGQQNCEIIEDLRIISDDSGNVFVVFMHWPRAECILISKFGDNIKFEPFKSKGRGKHPDVDVDEKHIYVVWQYKQGKSYTIALQQKEKKKDGNWKTVKIITKGSVQRPRVSVNGGIVHIIHHDGEDPTRTIFYRNSIDDYSSHSIVSRLDGPQRYIDISVLDKDNIVTSFRTNSVITYNLMRDGIWSGPKQLIKSRPTLQSLDIDSKKFSLVYVEGGSKIMMIVIGLILIGGIIYAGKEKKSSK